MKLLSVNIGAAQPINAKSGHSGIFKRSVPHAMVGALGLVGDTIVDVKHHGGPDQAVYVYTQRDYDWWAQTLGRDMAAGQFGENLTLDDWPAEDIAVGDRLHIGEVVLEVTSPRIPCVTLAVRMGMPDFPKAFLASKRTGPYLRVINGGAVGEGDDVVLVRAPEPRLRLWDWPGLFAPALNDSRDVEAWLAVPVHHKMKTDLEAKLAELRQ